MAVKGSMSERLREELRAERIRKGWSQEQVAKMLGERYNLPVYGTTITKIESGQRDVRVEELAAFSDLFGAPIDALLGNYDNGTDVLWAASKLSASAQKALGTLVDLREQLSEDAAGLFRYAQRDHRDEAMVPLLKAATTACSAIEDARAKTAELATGFPLPGMSFGR